MVRTEAAKAILWGLAAAAMTCAAADLPRAKWMQDGLIDAGGSHEPLSFVIRTGGQSANARQYYERAQSEDVIRRLKEQGIEVFHTHLYKGFGMAAEKPEIEDAKRVAAIAHKYGLKVDSHIQWDTLMPETFFAEEPRAKDWIQRDAAGKPLMVVYGFEQSWRYRPCFSNPNYLEYLRKIVRYAVEEVKTDFIRFDNFDLNPEPDSCHCDYCTRAFRAYLKAKYPPAVLKQRFGFENVDYVNPPLWNRTNPPEKLDAIRDPGIQEWIAFRCHEMSETLREIGGYARSLNHAVAIQVNPHGITGGNRAWENGLDHAQFLKWTDSFWTEEPNIPALEKDGRLVSRIRTYKLARAMQNIAGSLPVSKVALAECLAFNQTIGFAGEDPLRPDSIRFLNFYRKYRELYKQTEDDPTVAVLRSYPSIAYHHSRAQLGAVLVEQALIQARVPFRLIFDEHLSDLSKYKALILPDSQCLSDAQVAAIQAFVKNGGGLVAFGESGLYDEWYRPRPRPSLADLLPSQEPGESIGEDIEWHIPSGPTVQTKFGQGRAAYVPGAEFDGELPAMLPYFSITNKFWKNPKNARQIIDAVRWASGDSLPVRVSGPDYLVANLVSQPAQHRSMLHLVNYDAANTASIPSVDVTMPVTEGRKVAKVTVISPDSAEEKTLDTPTDSTGVHFKTPEIGTYSVVVVNWQ